MVWARSATRPFHGGAGRLLLGFVAAALCAAVAGVQPWRALGSSGSDPGGTIPGAVDNFFHSYVQPDGRVVRTDQGGDTVSEGQAYAMLMAVAVNNQTRFASVWHWTQANLQHPDGTLAWHWDSGRVVDTQSASDADLDAAWALALAGARFHDPGYSDAARHIAAGILDRETEQVDGSLVLVAGSWARQPEPTVDPSYFSGIAYSALFDLTDQSQWHDLYLSSAAIVTALTSNPARLPPDWAQVGSDRHPSAISSPSGSSTPNRLPSYGLDAARVELWSASDCHPGARQVSSGGWRFLQGTARQGQYPIRMTQLGAAESSYSNPLIAMADAASAAAAGNTHEANHLIDTAYQLSKKYPSYYGMAWEALGHILLSTNRLETCPPR